MDSQTYIIMQFTRNTEKCPEHTHTHVAVTIKQRGCTLHIIMIVLIVDIVICVWFITITRVWL